MEEKEKVIDLWSLAKLLYAYKLLVIGLALLGVAIGFGYKYMTLGIVYQTDIQLMLPLYCSDTTIATAINVADTKAELMNDSNDDCVITAQRAKPADGGANPNIISIVVQSSEPQRIEEIVEVYKRDLITYLNSFINDQAIYDMQRANLNSLKPLSKKELIENISLSLKKVTLSPYASVTPTLAHKIYAIPMSLGAFLGLFIAIVYVAVKHFEEIVKEESYPA